MQVAWGLIALEGVALIACGFLHWHADRSAKSSLVGLFSLLSALCLVLSVVAAAVREVSSTTLPAEHLVSVTQTDVDLTLLLARRYLRSRVALLLSCRRCSQNLHLKSCPACCQPCYQGYLGSCFPN